jgi:hypothetical protein
MANKSLRNYLSLIFLFTPALLFGLLLLFYKENEKLRLSIDAGINYNLYGFLKYGICLLGSLLTGWWLLKHAPLVIPLSVLSFYLLEVPFLFLFPLLLDHSSKPILTGLYKVFEIGIAKCLSIVMPIAFLMLAGLFRKRNGLRNWHLGCLAILIWYHNEVRTRV